MPRSNCIPAPPRELARRCAAPTAPAESMESAVSLLQNGEISVDIGIDQLRRRIGEVGNPDNELVYGYVIRTVRPLKGGFDQRGSGPNWQGGLVTLCTCKHGMRASLSTDEWLKGKWVAGLTGWSSAFGKQQSLVYLMRVGEACHSQAELVQQLRASGRESIVGAKDSFVHRLGDLMTPSIAGIPLDPHDPASYRTPVLGHAHRQSAEDDGWQDDIDYLGAGGRQAAMLAGDSRYSFVWTRAMVRRSRPGYTRPYRIWTLSNFLDDIEGASA